MRCVGRSIRKAKELSSKEGIIDFVGKVGDLVVGLIELVVWVVAVVLLGGLLKIKRLKK